MLVIIFKYKDAVVNWLISLSAASLYFKELGLGYIMNCVCNQQICLDKYYYHYHDIEDYHPDFEFDGMNNDNHSELDDYEIKKYVHRIVQFT